MKGETKKTYRKTYRTGEMAHRVGEGGGGNETTTRTTLWPTVLVGKRRKMPVCL